MSEETITTIGKTAETIAEGIRTIVRQTRMIVLQNAMEIGRLLLEAKEMVPYGEWGEYLEREVEFSKSTANNMMQLYKEYGSMQQSLFSRGFDSMMELPYTKALKLLAVPEEEREQFAEQVDAAHISNRELDQAIRERDEAKKREESARELQKAAQERFEEERNRVEQLTAEAKQKDIDAEKAKKEVAEAQKQLKEAKEQLEKAEAEKGKVSKDVMEQLRKDAEAAARQEAVKEYTQKLRNAEKEAEEAQKRAMMAEEKLKEQKKDKVNGDSDTAVFQAYFTEVQGQFQKLLGLLEKIRAEDPEKAEKLKAAVAALLKKMEDGLTA